MNPYSYNEPPSRNKLRSTDNDICKGEEAERRQQGFLMALRTGESLNH